MWWPKEKNQVDLTARLYRADFRLLELISLYLRVIKDLVGTISYDPSFGIMSGFGKIIF